MIRLKYFLGRLEYFHFVHRLRYFVDHLRHFVHHRLGLELELRVFYLRQHMLCSILCASQYKLQEQKLKQSFKISD